MFTSRFFGLSLPVAALLGLAALPAAAQTYSAANDFSDTSITGVSSNGAWNYGYETTLGGALTLYNETFPLTMDIRGLQSTNLPGDPSVFKNFSNHTATDSDISLAPGQLAFHPGPTGQYSVVRFIAPQAGIYDLTGSFSSATTVGATTDVHILDNSITLLPLYSGEIPSPSPADLQFSKSLVLASGDTIDFIVGEGTDGNYISDTTGLDATLTVAPEPSQVAPFAFLAFGLGAMVVLKKKKASAAA